LRIYWEGNVFLMPSLFLSSFLDDLERLTSFKYIPTDGTSPSSFSSLQRSQPPCDNQTTSSKPISKPSAYQSTNSRWKRLLGGIAVRSGGLWMLVGVGVQLVFLCSSLPSLHLPFLLSFVTLSSFPPTFLTSFAFIRF